ncbi:hypothetical protein HV118_04415 [Citrobacter freundii]|uniref:hypothetical protein n=1 Tax=Citrobacter freundii TaxID=546 RepID=UPI0015FDE022|nr:hypothetical protein [Citrobacter freundii]MBA7990369.1 hypothetical protein [Citrobacter freundii]
MTALNKQALTDEAISQAFTGTNFGRDDLRNILAETVIDAAAGWRCGYTATTICTQFGLLTATGRASALGLRFVSEHVCRETKRLKGALESAENRMADQHGIILSARNFISEYAVNGDAGAAEFVKILDRAAGIGVKGE